MPEEIQFETAFEIGTPMFRHITPVAPSPFTPLQGNEPPLVHHLLRSQEDKNRLGSHPHSVSFPTTLEREKNLYLPGHFHPLSSYASTHGDMGSPLPLSFTQEEVSTPPLSVLDWSFQTLSFHIFSRTFLLLETKSILEPKYPQNLVSL